MNVTCSSKESKNIIITRAASFEAALFFLYPYALICKNAFKGEIIFVPLYVQH